MVFYKFISAIVAIVCFACFGLDFARHGFEPVQIAFVALGILGPLAFMKQAQYHERRRAQLGLD